MLGSVRLQELPHFPVKTVPGEPADKGSEVAPAGTAKAQVVQAPAEKPSKLVRQLAKKQAGKAGSKRRIVDQ